MFAGIGGFPLGLEMVNQRISERQISKYFEGKQPRKQSYRNVWANEIDKHACQIYRKNFPNHTLIEGDIKEVNPADLPDIDVITGGFPCQPFSLAGKREGFQDIRGTLFFEIMRIAQIKRPKILFLENVKGLLNHDNGDTFETILRTLGNAGYWWEYKVLNSRYFGVPQNRERVFIIGHLREGCTRQVFPISSNGSEDTEIGEVAATLTGGGHSGGLHSNMTAIVNRSVRSGGRGSLDRHSWDIIQIKRTRADGNDMIRPYQDETPTLTSQMGTGGGNVPLMAQALQTDGFLRHGSSFGTNNPQSSRNIRRLTPTECERLQGFPDGWTEGISDTQRYKCLGNAVTVNVIKAIGELILEALD